MWAVPVLDCHLDPVPWCGAGPLVHDFMTSFIDDRDSGALLVTHFTLLLGMAAPLWLCGALADPAQAASGSVAGGSALPPAALAGMLIIGALGKGGGGAHFTPCYPCSSGIGCQSSQGVLSWERAFRSCLSFAACHTHLQA